MSLSSALRGAHLGVFASLNIGSCAHPDWGRAPAQHHGAPYAHEHKKERGLSKTIAPFTSFDRRERGDNASVVIPWTAHRSVAMASSSSPTVPAVLPDSSTSLHERSYHL